MSDPTPALPPASEIAALVERTLSEDVGSGDLTAGLLADASPRQAEIIAREHATFCGRAWADEVYRQLDDRVLIDWLVADGDRVQPNQCLARISGPPAALLTGERSALNLLQTLSATATRATRFVDAVAGTGARILDTRKTLPGLRSAQKYAVRCGGGCNHRMGLFDAILIKENHIAAAGGIAGALRAAAAAGGGVEVEIEVETLAQLEEALNAGAKRILLDNFSLELLRQAVSNSAGRARLEASGGIGLGNVREIAETGVDDISIGELTKHVTAVDLSMRLL